MPGMLPRRLHLRVPNGRSHALRQHGRAYVLRRLGDSPRGFFVRLLPVAVRLEHIRRVEIARRQRLFTCCPARPCRCRRRSQSSRYIACRAPQPRRRVEGRPHRVLVRRRDVGCCARLLRTVGAGPCCRHVRFEAPGKVPFGRPVPSRPRRLAAFRTALTLDVRLVGFWWRL
eukprot:366573-Chlamydomonas_euryale.AAC.50